MTTIAVNSLRIDILGQNGIHFSFHFRTEIAKALMH